MLDVLSYALCICIYTVIICFSSQCVIINVEYLLKYIAYVMYILYSPKCILDVRLYTDIYYRAGMAN